MKFLALLCLVGLAGCSTRKLESCLAHIVILGPGLVTLDCRPPHPFAEGD